MFFRSATLVAGRALRPLLLAGLLPLAAACDNDDDRVVPAALPDQVSFTQTGLYPEGQQYDSQGSRFLVSSQTAGRVGQVRDDGTYTAFGDDASLVSTIGLNLDAGRDRLLVAVSDPGYNTARTSAATKGKLAGLAFFTRSTGTFVRYVPLSSLRPAAAGHFANDIAVDDQGNAYVTDSYAPLIYKVDPQGTATVLLENAALAAPAGTFGLNGIVYHPDGYLLVAKSDEGKVLKVPLSNPTSFSTVALPAGLSLTGDDGLLLVDKTTLLAACNAQGRVYRLTSTDGFATIGGSSAFVTGAVYPTTLSRRGDSGYVLYSHLNALQAMQNPPVDQFSLTQVKF